MDAYLLIIAFIIFAIFAIYKNTKALFYMSKCFIKETRQEHDFPTRLKALMLPKSMWINKTKGKYTGVLPEL